jgi:hypothetical protein
MQSSAAVACRALIMFACVVGIPVIALSGTSWSGMVKRLQDFRWPAVLNPASASTSDETGSATSHGLATPASTAPARLTLQSSVAPSPQSAVMPAAYQELAAATLPAVHAADGTATGPVPGSPGMFVSIQDRLRRLGATYYLLEAWGNGQQLYRFYCKMAVGGNADYTRSFEAANADPLEAMREVLRQVEQWKGGGKTE